MHGALELLLAVLCEAMRMQKRGWRQRLTGVQNGYYYTGRKVVNGSTQHLQGANIIKGREQREMAGVCQDAVADGAEVAAVSTP